MILGDSYKSSVSEINLNLWKKNSSATGWLEACKMPVQWQTDISFIKEELRFFSLLISRYFLSLQNTENSVSIGMAASELREVETRQRCLSQKISRLIRHMHELMAENPFSFDAQALSEEHSILERELIDFVKEVRMIKRKIFEIMERSEEY